MSKPKVYTADHPSNKGQYRVMYRDERGNQHCLVDELETKGQAETIRKWVGSARPKTLSEARVEARMAGR